MFDVNLIIIIIIIVIDKLRHNYHWIIEHVKHINTNIS